MKFHNIFLSALCLMLLVAASHAEQVADQNPQEKLEQTAVAQLATHFENMHSLTANFSQRIKDDQGEILQTASGQLTVQRPRRFYWRTDQPYEYLVVTDGTILWLYDVDLEQITRQPFSAAMDQAPALLLSGEIELISQQFQVSLLPLRVPATVPASTAKAPLDNQLENVARPNRQQFLLQPKNSGSVFRELGITFVGDKLVAMSLLDNFDQLTEIDFNQVLLNPSVDEQLFIFTPPAGIDVIDHDG